MGSPATPSNEKSASSVTSDASLFLQPQLSTRTDNSYEAAAGAQAVNSPGVSSSRVGVKNQATSAVGWPDSSIYGWLKDVLESDDNVKDVVAALRKLHISKEVVRHDTSTQDPTVYVTTHGIPLLPVRRLQAGPRLDRAIAVLDRTTPSTTHKIALMYAGPRKIGSGETDPEAILLSTIHCSPEFHRFADGLGKMVATKHLRYFSAGLDVSKYESDGRFTRAWVGHEGLSLPASKSIVVYHVVHLMPEGITSRKRHVGNDNVLIIFLDKDSPVAVDIDLSEDETDYSVVSGHFAFVTIYVSVLVRQPDLARVTVRIRDGLPDELRQELLSFAGNDIVAMHDAPVHVRSLAIRADLACRSVLENLAPASNCFERYRMLREMGRHVVK
jgi:hypothetical protein